MWPKPAPSQAATTSFNERKAISWASRRVRFISAPEWITTRAAPIRSATRQAPVI